MNQYRGEAIFNDYVRLMREKGLISKAAEGAEKSSVWSESEKQSDKSYRENIEALYGVKPNGDEPSAFDVAHPEPIIAGPSYDRVNGLFENEKERHDIMTGIITQRQKAKLTQTRYAAELQNQLLLIAQMNDTDDTADALVVLADSCAERLNKQAMPLLLPVAAAVAAVLGTIYVMNNFNVSTQPIIDECSQTIEAIDAFSPMATDLSAQMTELKAGVGTLKSMVSDIFETPVSGKNLSDALRSQENQALIKKIAAYKTFANDLKKSINDTFIGLVKSHRSTTESGGFFSSLEKMYHYLIPDEQAKLVKHLNGLISSIEASVNDVEEKQHAVNNYVNNNQDKVMNQLHKENEGDAKGVDGLMNQLSNPSEGQSKAKENSDNDSKIYYPGQMAI